MKDTVKIIIGVALVTIGGLLLIERLGILLPFTVNVWEIIGLFWPLILIAIGIKLLLDQNVTGGVIILTIGSVILLTNIFNWNFFAVLWPLLIIALGVSILVKKEDFSVNTESYTQYKEDYIRESIAFWGSEKKLVSKSFKGGELNVAFGGLTLDLRDVTIHKDGAHLNVNAIFAGAEIIVPKNCRVKTNGTGIFGGWEPNVKETDTKGPVLNISGTAIFGGVEIRE